MSDEFEINIPIVHGEGVGVPIGQIQNAINIICQQMQTDLNLIASGGFPLTDVDITGGTITGVTISNSTGVTQSTNDNSTLLATDQFVNQQIIRSTTTVPLTVTGGVYNQATLGTGFQPVVFATAGVVTGILTIAVPGTGYAVGDLVTLAGGNVDATLRITAIGAGGSVTTASILYGGTGYTTGAQLTGTPIPPGDRNVILTGVLTSNVTFIISAGTFDTASRRPSFVNNTTGAFSITVFLSNGAGGTTGTGYVLPQGTNNSTSVLLQTDGETGVWPIDTPLGIGAVAASGGTMTGGTINNTTIGATIPSTGAFTTLTATTPVAVSSGGTGRATLLAHGVLVGEGTGGINQLAVGNTGQMLLGSSGADPGFGNNPTITGGTIDNAVIGGTTPAAATVTTLNVTTSGTFAAINNTPIGPTTPSTGAFTTLSSTGNFTPSQTNGIVGTTTNNNANAGSVGEYVPNTGTAVSLTTATAANVTSISLTAGDWDVWGSIEYDAAGSTTISQSVGGINTASATLPASPFKTITTYALAAGGTIAGPVPQQRLILASTTTVFLVGFCAFATGTLTATGVIQARRIR
jgi:hypothetical protein